MYALTACGWFNTTGKEKLPDMEGDTIAGVFRPNDAIRFKRNAARKEIDFSFSLSNIASDSELPKPANLQQLFGVHFDQGYL